jgi:hypothetical protein
MILIGIDPGASGGIATYHHTGDVNVFKMPETEMDVVRFFENIAVVECKALIERIHGMPGMAGTAMFSFGKGYGVVRAAMLAFKIPFDEVTPQKWQKTLGCLTGGDKNVSKARAQQLFPQIKVTHAVADALLIMEYLRRRELGTT